MKIHYNLVYSNDLEFVSKLDELIACGIDSVFLSAIPAVLSTDILAKLKSLSKAAVNLTIDFDNDLIHSICPNSVILPNDDANLKSIRNEYPNMRIGAAADSITQCKNWELLEIDFLVLNWSSFQSNRAAKASILGSEDPQTIFPQKEPYGWMLLSLNTPIIAAGFKSINELAIVLNDSYIDQILISSVFEPHLSISQKVNKFKTLFNS